VGEENEKEAMVKKQSNESEGKFGCTISNLKEKREDETGTIKRHVVQQKESKRMEWGDSADHNNVEKVEQIEA
jgi:hypothetical protein